MTVDTLRHSLRAQAKENNTIKVLSITCPSSGGTELEYVPVSPPQVVTRVARHTDP